jgi:hypothetical protein
MKRLSIKDIPYGMTKGDLADKYDIGTYDTALPQSWVDQCVEHDFDPRGVVVWAYPLSMPYPLTIEAELEIDRIFGWDCTPAKYKEAV